MVKHRLNLQMLLLACTSPDTSSPKHTYDSVVDTATTTDTESPIDTEGPGNTLHLAIPSYAYPGDGPAWEGFVEGAASGGLVIINPNSGPGERLDANYQSATLAAQAAGALVLGYVSTRYGTRDAALIDAEVAQYTAWYGVDGIFFDEVPTTESCEGFLDWYAARAAVARQVQNATVIFNPGAPSCEGFLQSADILVAIETQGENVLNWTAPAWQQNYPPERFWLLAHTAPETMLDPLLTLARAQNIGWFYVTDDVLPNPWDQLPTYWAQEQDGLTQ